MVLELFSQQTIYNLIDILFKDMAEDYKMLQDNEEGSEEDEDEHEDENTHDKDGDQN